MIVMASMAIAFKASAFENGYRGECCNTRILFGVLLIANLVLALVALYNDDTNRLVFNACIAIICAVLFTYRGNERK